MPRNRRWNAARSLASWRPPDPLLSGCSGCARSRTCIRIDGQLHCLRCAGCPWCGQRRWTEEILDQALVEDPVRLAFGNRQQLVVGDWVCSYGCGRTLVDWASWRRRMRNWQKGRKAMAEGYKTRRKAA